MKMVTISLTVSVEEAKSIMALLSPSQPAPAPKKAEPPRKEEESTIKLTPVAPPPSAPTSTQRRHARVLRKWRLSNDLSQKEAANMFGVPQSSWSNFENPQCHAAFGRKKQHRLRHILKEIRKM
tara:strand:+ start:1786 stop:2157 length:372 start_codon:yes stop_codon:yes gene_type:complete